MFRALSTGVLRGQRKVNNWIVGDRKTILCRALSTHKQKTEEYTHVIVGAGSAGCVLANRLTANSSNKVLLVEAGPTDKSWKIQVPAAMVETVAGTEHNWSYFTAPQKHMDDRMLFWPRGKVLGGTSSMNAMVYMRGHPYDYERWVNEGAEGWSYAECLPYFKRAQCHEHGEDTYRGGDGPLNVSTSKLVNPLWETFINAGVARGYPRTSDFNGYQQEGFGYIDMTIHKGVRWSTYNAYLRANGVEKRDNLTISPSSFTERVLFEGTKAVGIEYVKDNERKTANATGEVILSGGAINSPQLLMLSGVGNADDLKRLDIPIVAHLPGVGQNLQDHTQMVVQYRCKKPITYYSLKNPFNLAKEGLKWLLFRSGLGSSCGVEAGAFIRSHPGIEHPNIQSHFWLVVNDHGSKSEQSHAFQFNVCLLRPTSRGSITLKSRDPKEHPLIDPNYLDTEVDRRGMRDCIKFAREIVYHSSFDPYRGDEISPGTTFQSDEELDAAVRAKMETIYHPTSTCKMGAEDDNMAVVDNHTRVMGIQNLRVVDASVMPSIMSGNTNAPTIMIAEKAADSILGNKPLDKIDAPFWKPATLDNTRSGTAGKGN